MFEKYSPLLSGDQHETSSAHGTCSNSMILRSILKSAKPIGFFACLKIEKNSEKTLFFRKNRFLSPNSAQSPPNFQIFTVSTQYMSPIYYSSKNYIILVRNGL